MPHLEPLEETWFAEMQRHSPSLLDPQNTQLFLSLAHMKILGELGETLVSKSSQTQVSVAGWFLKVQDKAKVSPVVNHQDG